MEDDTDGWTVKALKITAGRAGDPFQPFSRHGSESFMPDVAKRAPAGAVPASREKLAPPTRQAISQPLRVANRILMQICKPIL